MTTSPTDALPEHDNALPVGTRLGEFEILGVIGVGGFGIVYRALDHDLEREVAIKEYMPGQFAGRDATGAVTVRARTHAETFGVGLRSFINEARLLARFDHPALLKVYRYWEANGTAYMAMPYYRGRTLAQALKERLSPPAQDWLLRVIEPLLGALDLLHQQQVYHRDISPDNILLLDDGQPVLLDFGAARRVIGDHTQTLTAILKPQYAPIEQYAEIPGLKQGPWTDLYALGAVVYSVLSGYPPAPAATRAVLDNLVPLDQVGEQLRQRHGISYGAAFLATWQRTLAIKPADRPQSVAALRAELAGQPPNPAPVAATAPPPPRAVLPDEAVDSADDTDDPERTIIHPSALTRPNAAAVPTPVPPARTQPPARPSIAPRAPPTAPKTPVNHQPTPSPSAGRGLMLGLGLAGVLIVAGGLYALKGGGKPATVAEQASSAASTPALPASIDRASAAPDPAPPPPIVQAASTDTTAASSPSTAASKAATSASIAGPMVKASGSARPASGSKIDNRKAASASDPASAVLPVEQAASRPVTPPPPGPATATEACGKRILIAKWNCMSEQCKHPEFERQEDCTLYLSE
ncbi:MAG: hypothetical protein RJA44_49, partial [Pseudomonadota bacterium]